MEFRRRRRWVIGTDADAATAAKPPRAADPPTRLMRSLRGDLDRHRRQSPQKDPSRRWLSEGFSPTTTASPTSRTSPITARPDAPSPCRAVKLVPATRWRWRWPDDHRHPRGTPGTAFQARARQRATRLPRCASSGARAIQLTSTCSCSRCRSLRQALHRERAAGGCGANRRTRQHGDDAVGHVELLLSVGDRYATLDRDAEGRAGSSSRPVRCRGRSTRACDPGACRVRAREEPRARGRARSRRDAHRRGSRRPAPGSRSCSRVWAVCATPARSRGTRSAVRKPSSAPTKHSRLLASAPLRSSSWSCASTWTWRHLRGAGLVTARRAPHSGKPRNGSPPSGATTPKLLPARSATAGAWHSTASDPAGRSPSCAARSRSRAAMRTRERVADAAPQLRLGVARPGADSRAAGYAERALARARRAGDQVVIYQALTVRARSSTAAPARPGGSRACRAGSRSWRAGSRPSPSHASVQLERSYIAGARGNLEEASAHVGSRPRRYSKRRSPEGRARHPVHPQTILVRRADLTRARGDLATRRPTHVGRSMQSRRARSDGFSRHLRSAYLTLARTRQNRTPRSTRGCPERRSPARNRSAPTIPDARAAVSCGKIPRRRTLGTATGDWRAGHARTLRSNSLHDASCSGASPARKGGRDRGRESRAASTSPRQARVAPARRRGTCRIVKMTARPSRDRRRGLPR